MNSTETKGITDRYSPLARLVTAAGPDFGAAAVFEDAIAAVFDAAQDIMLSKRAQRGTDNITEQGLSGVLARLASDKAARLRATYHKTVLWEAALENPSAFPAEGLIIDANGLVDDLLDTINYAVIALTLLYGVWSLPQLTTEETHGA